jgi:hypothetical protein
MRILVKDSIEVTNQVILENDLIGQQMRKQREGRGVEPGKLGSEAFVSILILMNGASEVAFVLVQSSVLTIGARLLLLQSFGTALVSLVVNLVTRPSVTIMEPISAGCTFLSSRFLIAFFIGLSASLASLAGSISFFSMSFTSSIMSVLSSAKASCSLTHRSIVSGGVSG